MCSILIRVACWLISAALAAEFPGKTILLVSVKNGEGVAEWFEILKRERSKSSPLAIDYDIYAEGEALLGWLNATIEVKTPQAIDSGALLKELAAGMQATMRFVPVKSVDQQAVTALHRARALLVRQRTMAANALRGLLAEFGVVFLLAGMFLLSILYTYRIDEREVVHRELRGPRHRRVAPLHEAFEGRQEVLRPDRHLGVAGAEVARDLGRGRDLAARVALQAEREGAQRAAAFLAQHGDHRQAENQPDELGGRLGGAAARHALSRP